MASHRFIRASLIALLTFSFGLSWVITGPITPLIVEDLDINQATAGLLLSIVFFVHAIFGIPSSLLIGLIGLKMRITLGALVGSAPILTFLIPDSFIFLLALRACHAFGFMILFTTVGPLFMRWFRPSELPVVNGIFVVSGILGTIVSSAIIAQLSETLGWPKALSIFGAITLFAATIWIIFGKDEKRPEANQGHLSKQLWGLLRDRKTILVIIGDAGPLALLTACFAWLPSFYHQVHNMSLTHTGWVMALIQFTGLLSLSLATFLTKRIKRRRPFIIFPGIIIGFAGFASIFLSNHLGIYMAVSLLGFCCWFYLPALLTIPMDLYPNNPRIVSLFSALILSIAGSASVISPFTVGAISDLTGSLVPGLSIFAILAWSLGIAGILLPETGPSSKPTGN
jgi:MFS family permease